MLSLITAICIISRRCSQNQISVYAAQSSFFMILSALPLIMLLTAAVQSISPLSQGSLMSAILELVPASLKSYLVTLIDELYRNISSTIISLSALTVLWAASKGIYALELGLNQIYQVDQKRHFLVRRLLAVGYTLAFIVIVLLCLILLVFGNRLQILLTHTFPLLGQITAFILNLRSFLSIAILTLFFSLLYKVLPNRPLSYKKQLPGAVFAALGWVLFSFFYSIYIDNFSNYAHIYGSMTALILLCLWIYVCMNIVLIGAQINMWLSERESSSTQPRKV